MTRWLGHDGAIASLARAAAGGRLHHGWIFAGPRGLGKAGIARAFATRLLADAAGPPPLGEGIDVEPDHRIARLVAAGTHPDFVLIERLEKAGEGGELARAISADQVRGLARTLANAPALSTRRVVMIDAADDMDRFAANALLKNLEEPPQGTIFLLVAHAPQLLLPTIRSRCRVIRFAPLGEADMRAALREALPVAPVDEIDALVRSGEGAPGRAIARAGLDVAGLERALHAIARDGDPDNVERAALAKALSGKAARERFALFLALVPQFLARMARTAMIARLGEAGDAWSDASAIAAEAGPLNLDPAATVYRLCAQVARLAPVKV
jgi:DNA polymerase-3 subunit delta'